MMRRAPTGRTRSSAQHRCRTSTSGLSGGTETLRYNVDGSFFKQQGIVIGSGYNRANARVNVDYDATAKFRLKTSIGLARENNDRIEGNNSDNGIVTNAIGQPAVYHVKNPDGSFTSTADTTPSDNSEVYSNPVAIGTYDRLPEQTDHILGNVEGNYLFNSHLTLTGSAGADILKDHEDQWRSPLVVGNYAYGAHGVALTTFDNTNHYLLQSYLTYQNGSDEGSALTVVGGGSMEYNTEESAYLRGEGFSSPEFQYVGSAANLIEFGGVPTGYNLESFFGRANYSYKNRYLLQGSMRSDGSSRFGANNRWAYFPALSAGWVISDESFMGNFGKRFGTLKLRGSFGKTGNQSIPNFASLSSYGSGTYGSTPGIEPVAFGNPNLKWETTKEWDGGIDFAPFGGRLTVIADYYHKATSDLLVNRPLPCVIGYCSYYDNIGDVLNRGFEFGLNSENFRPSTRERLLMVDRLQHLVQSQRDHEAQFGPACPGRQLSRHQPRGGGSADRRVLRAALPRRRSRDGRRAVHARSHQRRESAAEVLGRSWQHGRMEGFPASRVPRILGRREGLQPDAHLR